MESRPLDDDLLRMLGRWCRDKCRSFPRWDYDEILNESYIACLHIHHRYRKDKGSYLSFLYNSLYCPVSRSYFKAFSITVNGKREGKRVYSQRCFELRTQPEDAYIVDDPIEFTIPDKDGMLNLLGRGLTQRQTASVLGLTESRISQRLRALREQTERPY